MNKLTENKLTRKTPMAMDFVPFLFPLCIILWAGYHVLRSTRRAPKLPPGPPLTPIVGNILQLGQNLHESLAKLAKSYGPIMHLKLGTIDTIVVSSPELAKKVLRNHDHVLSSRPSPAGITVHGHNTASVVWLPMTSRWLLLRKICKDQMFSLQKIKEGEGLRREKLKQLRDYVKKCSDSGRVLDIRDAIFVTFLNLMSASLFSLDFGQLGSDPPEEFNEIVRGVMKAEGAPNLSDYFPVLKAFDPQGIQRESAKIYGKAFRFFEEIIDRRLRSDGGDAADGNLGNDLLGELLEVSRKNESELSRNDIIHLLLDLFAAGIETTATTTEWAMALLIGHPKKMAKARNELQTIIMQKGSHLDESDITQLPYLQAVVKETFRIHPTAPLLLPHKAEVDTEINGYIIPKDAQVLINVWAIGRDSSLWSNPDSFEPERFLGSNIDIGGHNFELIPFGSGRRFCPGFPLAYRMVHLMVATMIEKFEWKVEGENILEEINMDEEYDLSLRKAVPLKAIPVEL